MSVVSANATAAGADPISQLLEDKDNIIEKIRGIYGLKVKNAAGQEGLWVFNLKEGDGKLQFNGKDKPDVTFVVNDEDIMDLVTGKLLPQKAFFQGKIKLQGNMGMALKLAELQKKVESKLDQLKAKL